MTYALQADLEARYGDEVAQFVAANAAAVAQALADADALIDGYLAGRYSLPLASVPPILKQYACDIARYRLYSDAANDVVLARYKDAVNYLTRLGSGQISLGVSTPEPVSGGVSFSTPGRVFDADSLGAM
jgi:phage gp36-like protein